MTEQNLGNQYLDNSIKAFQSLKSTAEKAMAQLSPEQYHWQPDPESNSVTILIKHLTGNMFSRWTDFLTTDGEKPNRNRDSEFEDENLAHEQLIARWERGWNVLFDALSALTADDLLKTVLIRNEPHTVMKAIHRQLTHYAAHIGQIYYIAKMLKGENWQSLTIPKKK
jgi:hypothetical protein